MHKTPQFIINYWYEYKKCIILSKNIEGVYFVWVNKEMIENSLVFEDCSDIFDLCTKGYKFYKKIKNKE